MIDGPVLCGHPIAIGFKGCHRCLPFDANSRAMLMDIVEDRHGKRSTIIASQVPVKNWYDVIGEQTIADAILDRLVHQSTRIELAGESLRKSKAKTTAAGATTNI